MESAPPLFVGFGMLTPVEILVVNQLPPHNTSAITTDVTAFLFDGAALVACVLRQWDVPTCIIGSLAGDGERGHNLAHKLQEWGVQGTVRFTHNFKTPLEVDVSGRAGLQMFSVSEVQALAATLKVEQCTLLGAPTVRYFLRDQKTSPGAQDTPR